MPDPGPCSETQPRGHPISHVTNSGFKDGFFFKDFSPSIDVSWPGREQWNCTSPDSDSWIGFQDESILTAICRSTCRLPLAVIPVKPTVPSAGLRPPFGAFGVGQNRIAAVRESVAFPCPPHDSASSALGVGHILATSFSGRAFFSSVSFDASPDRQSLAAGVGHSLLCAERAIPLSWLFCCPCSSALGVDHILVTTFRLVAFFLAPPFILAFIAMCASGDLLSSFATGVGQNSEDEEPLSKVRSAHFSRREDSTLSLVAKSLKLSEHFLKPDGDEAWDVFEEAEVGLAFVHDSDEMRE